jgi:hypothetical protein
MSTATLSAGVRRVAAQPAVQPAKVLQVAVKSLSIQRIEGILERVRHTPDNGRHWFRS